MNILFLSLSGFTDVNIRGIYSDLMRELAHRGNRIYIASPMERRFGKPTTLLKKGEIELLKIKTLNIQKTNIFEKGIATLLMEYQFDNAISKYWSNIRFDLVLYSTPPITFNKVIKRVKRRCMARSYLMLKDIFPQNAVDLGMMREGSILHRIFRHKEEQLYRVSDIIGCMSPANCRYLIEHNPWISSDKVELCPNAIMPIEKNPISIVDRNKLLEKFGIPNDRMLFIYGGNLGKPQGVDFLLRIIRENETSDIGYIIVVGNGTEFNRISKWFDIHAPKNALLLSALPKDEYDKLIELCDVGLIFLDPRFTIPNFPSRLLSYLENRMPVLLATDESTDIGYIAEREGFGLWCKSGDLKKYMTLMKFMHSNPKKVKEMGLMGERYFLDHYTVDRVADIIESK